MSRRVISPPAKETAIGLPFHDTTIHIGAFLPWDTVTSSRAFPGQVETQGGDIWDIANGWSMQRSHFFMISSAVICGTL